MVQSKAVYFQFIGQRSGRRRCNLSLLPYFTLAGVKQSVACHAAHEMLIRFDDTFATLLDCQSSPIIAIISTYLTLNWYRCYCSLPGLVSFATPCLHVRTSSFKLSHLPAALLFIQSSLCHCCYMPLLI